jgi:hypothetical protein
MGRRCLLLLLIGACDKSTSPNVAAKDDDVAQREGDPWAATPTADPWAAKQAVDTKPDPEAEVAPEAPSKTPASGGLPAGTYACQQMNFTPHSPPTYTSTGISFVLDGNGGYSAPHFKGGKGTVSLEGNVMSFNGGAMNGWRGYTGTVASGPFVRIRLKDPTAIATSLTRGDGMCYRQR